MSDVTTPDLPDLRTLAANVLVRLHTAAPSVADHDDPGYWLADADAVLAAVLPAHRDLVLDEAAQAILDAGRDPYQNLAWMYPDQAAEVVRRLAATTPADGPASTVPAENAPAVGREAAQIQGSAEAVPLETLIEESGAADPAFRAAAERTASDVGADPGGEQKTAHRPASEDIHTEETP